MATATLQSFNVFLTERLTAAAVDIYGFVEKTIIDYQDEVYRTKLENQRLQRLLDLVYKPEIRLHRTDTTEIDLPSPAQEVCAQEQQTGTQCVLKEEPDVLSSKEDEPEPWTKPVETPVETPVCSSYSSMKDSLTQVKIGEARAPRESKMQEDDVTEVVTIGEHSRYSEQDSLIQMVTVGEHLQYENPAQEEQPLPLYRVSTTFARKKDMFFCNICGRPFIRKEKLRSHIAAHATRHFPKFNNRTYTCTLCNKVTYTKNHMLTHIKSHNNEKPFPCPICGNRYKLKSHVKEHIRTHTGERPFTCFICGLGFNRSSTLGKHARSQHGEHRPFRCEHCGLRFPLYIVLKQHMRTVHNIVFPIGDEQPLEQS